jgi:outer membrane protein
MLKRTIVIFFLSVLCLSYAYSQQITRMAVVDLPRVYTEFFTESKAVRDFQQRTTRVQTDIDKMNKEIQDLKNKHADAILKDDSSEMLKLEGQINTRTENLRVFYQTRMAELDKMRQGLMQSNTFINQVHDEIRYIAESKGYTAVFDIKNTPGIIWFSPSVDITNDLIQSLKNKAAKDN